MHLRGDGEGFLCVEPSESHPVSEGRLCARGWAASDATRWSERLLTPQVREGGALRPASWNEALGVAVQALTSLRREGRPLGVLGSGRATNESNFLAVTLARSALGTGHVDAGLRDGYQALLPPRLRTSELASPDTDFRRLEQTDVVVLVEGDVATTHPRVAMAILRVLRRGGHLITLGRRRTKLSRVASVSLAMHDEARRPILHALRCTVIDTMRGTYAVAAGAAPSALERAAALMAPARRAAFVLAPFDADTAVLQATAAEVTRFADDLVASGAGAPLMLPLPIRANTRGALDMGAVPDALPGRFPLDDAGARDRLRTLWGGEPCFTTGRPAAEMLGAVSGLVVVADDPLSFDAWPSRAAAQLAALTSLVVLDSYATPTARAAHVVLPIAAFGEEEGTLTNLEGRVQRWRPCVDPPPNVRPAWLVLSDLLHGLGARFAPRTLEAVEQGIRTAVPSIDAMRNEAPVPETDAPARDAAPRWLLRRDGMFDWADDALVTASPILRRDAASARRLYPNGVVMMNADDAGSLGVREGWRVRLHSSMGEADVPVTLRDELERGVLMVPFAHRDRLAAVSGAAAAIEVSVTCV
ncbi:MAG: molybdopterin-dependent oxidoreductase [Gemmatimonadetes bacterium]|nr:molybdopterin-dependent oxidoreductase [Gemmatimonadota bacterium]